MNKTNRLFIFLVFFQTLSIAQNSENPWALNIGADLITHIRNGEEKEIQGLMAPTLGLTRHIYKGVSVGVQYTPNFIGRKNEELYFNSVDWILKYNISEKKLTPHFYMGYGLSAIKNSQNNLEGTFPSSESFRTIFGGIGVHYFLNEQWALNYSSSYRTKAEKDAYNHLQHIVGLSFQFGASDLDGDGIADNKDACQTIPGLKEFSGCPDSDGDGIPDPEDDCPMETGLEIHKGCPDADDDGIPDNKDACPDEVGPPELMGCPDRDGDEIADADDECPNVSGPKANNGCPYKDTDGDGVPDNKDSCPEEAGRLELMGCPDSDGDGITDTQDQCPEVHGLKENKGCPKAFLDIAFLDSDRSTLLFVVGQHKLTVTSIKKLNELKNFLKKYPNRTISIEGHASNEGSDAFNMKLSKRRALTVKEKLISLGVSENRIKTLWFGENKPKHSNNTAKGRALNRRVKIN